MTLDEWLCNIPVLGPIITRLYNYFRQHILFTDFIHVCLGLGMGLLIVSKWMSWGLFFLGVGIIGHIYAFIKG